MSLSELLEGDFFNEYIKSGTNALCFTSLKRPGFAKMLARHAYIFAICLMYID